jgi:hypothetical protein
LINLLSKIFLISLMVFSFTPVNSQLKNTDDIELNQEQWEAVRDTFAIYAIKFLARLDTLNMQIDSLREVNRQADTRDCEAELYALVGATKEQVEDFRRKFSETEKKVNGKIGTPDDARAMYFNEISASKIRCLPEFADRYASMKKKLEPWQSNEITSTEGSYSVAKGDCLWRISNTKYNTPYLWPAIWDANKSIIINPNLIYPGQVLKIPSVSDSMKKEAEEKSKYYRINRRTKRKLE